MSFAIYVPSKYAFRFLIPGYCPAEENGAPMMVLELMKYGDLQSFLQSNKYEIFVYFTEPQSAYVCTSVICKYMYISTFYVICTAYKYGTYIPTYMYSICINT